MVRAWWIRWGALALGTVVLFPLVPTAAANAASLADEPLVVLAEIPACSTVLDRLIDLNRCADQQEAVAAAAVDSAPDVAVAAGPELPDAEAPTAVPAQIIALDVDGATVATTPVCPDVTPDAVYDDPTGDWDGDGISNAIELYNELDPCQADALGAAPRQASAAQAGAGVPVAVAAAPEPSASPAAPAAPVAPAQAEAPKNPCPNYTAADVLADPNGDWDKDKASNTIEFYNQQDPCVLNATMNAAVAAVLAKPQPSATSPCPTFSAAEVNAAPTADWDNDGASNTFEFYNNSNPCEYDAGAAARARAVETKTADPSTTPCPGFNVADVLADPDSDWDQDRISNTFEFYNNMNPCVYTAEVLASVGTFIPGPKAGSPCPNFTLDNIFNDPDSDWDNDGKTNVAEFYDNGQPCVYQAVAAPATTTRVTPVARVTSTPRVTPAPRVTPVAGTTPAPTATPAPGTTPAPTVTPAPGTTPAPTATPAPGTTPAPTTTPAPGTTPTPTSNPAPEGSAVWSVSGGVATATVASGSVNHTLRLNGDSLELVGGAAGDVSSLPLAGVTSIVVTGTTANDNLVIDLSGGAFPVAVTFDGGFGIDKIYGPAPDTEWSITGFGSGHVVGVSFTGVENLVGAADNQDTFTFEQSGALSGRIDGGPGGFDSLVTNGTYNSVVNNPTAPDAGTVTLDGNVITYVGLEPVAQVGGTDFVFALPAGGNGDAVLRVFAADPTRLEIAGAGFEDTNFSKPTNSLTINGGSGIDTLTIEGVIDLGNAILTISTEIIRVLAGTTITTTRDINLNASASSTGTTPLPAALAPYAPRIAAAVENATGIEVLLAEATSEVTVSGATLRGANVNITANSSATSAPAATNFALTIANTSSTVSVVDTVIEATGNVAISTTTNVNASATGQTTAGSTLRGVDGAIGVVIADSTSESEVTGSTTISATGDLSVSATNTVTATGQGLADVDAAGSGAGVAIVDVDKSTVAKIDSDTANWTAGSLTVKATSNDTVSTTSSTSPNGATTAPGSPSPNTRTGGNATTSAGTVDLAGSISYTSLDSTVTASVNGPVVILSNGAQVIEALSTHNAIANATGSTANGAATGVAVAVAVTDTNTTSTASVGGGAALDASGVTIRVGNDTGPDSNIASATSGATNATSVGVAGSVAVNLANGVRAATIGTGGATVNGDLTITADSTATDTTTANAGLTGNGFGASVALAIANETSSARVADGAALGANIDDLNLSSTLTRTTNTTSQTGAVGGGGVTAAPSIAVTVSNLDAIAARGVGSSATIGGSSTMTSIVTGDVTTSASGNVTGGAATAAVGVALSLAFVDHDASALSNGALIAGGDVTANSLVDSSTTTTATAGAAGGSNSNASGDVNAQVAAQRNQANTTAANNGGAGVGGPAAPSASTSSGSISVGAAVALSVVKAASRSVLDALGSITATTGTGIVTFRSQADVDATTSADASAAAGTGATAVGVAVAINKVEVTNTASIAGAVVSNALIVDAANPAGADNAFAANAKSGGSGTNAIAVSLAMNLADVTTTASLDATSNTTASGGDVSITADSLSASVVDATPNPVVGASLGIGGSVALNLVNDSALARIANGAALVLAMAMQLVVVASGGHTMSTNAEAGAGSTGLSLAPAIAISLSDVERRAVIEGPADPLLELLGSLTIAGRAPPTALTTTTTATGSAESSGSAAAGVSLALTVIDHDVTASLARSTTAGGDITIEAIGQSASTSTAQASAKGAPADGQPGAPASVDSQVAQQRNLAESQASANTGRNAAGSAGTPSATSSSGPIKVAAAIAINVADTASTASLLAGVTATAAGAVTVRSTANTGSNADADGSASDGMGGAGGNASVGIAVAINVANVDNTATVGGDVVAADTTIAAGNTDVGGDTSHGFGAEATSGASGASVAVALSLALNIADVATEATLAATGSVTATGTVVISVDSNATSSATAGPNDGAIVGTSLGVGASLALNIVDDAATAAIQGDLSAGSASVAVTAAGGHSMTTTSNAGAKGGVALAPSVAISLSTVDRIASVAGSGAALVVDSLTVSAVAAPAANSVNTTATGSSESTGAAAAGVALGLTIVDHQVMATVGRNVTAGGAVTVEALGQSVASSSATASAKGAPGAGEAGAPTGGVDGQVAAERNLADSQATANGAGGSGAGPTPSAASSSGPISVAAAVAVTVVETGSLASIAAGVTVQSGATVTVRSGANTDSSAAADGSASTDAGSLAVGAAIAINLADLDNVASVVGSVNAARLVVGAGMTDVAGDGEHDSAATAISGASGANASIAVSLGLNIVTVDTSATIGTASSVTVTGDVEVSADSIGVATVGATPHEPAVGTKFGIGASLGLNIVTDRAIAEIAASALSADGDVSIAATGGHKLTTLSQAGAGSAGVALVPSVAIVLSTVDRTARVTGSGSVLSVGRDLSIRAANPDGANDTMTTAKGSASSSGSAAAGIALGLAVVNHSTSASIGRSVTAGRDVEVSSTGTSSSVVEAEASAKGAPASGQPGAPDAGGGSGTVDSQVGAERGLADSQAMTNGGANSGAGATPSASSSSGPIKVAAAIAIDLLTVGSAASVLAGVVVTATGSVTVRSASSVAGSAVADGSSSDGTGGGGGSASVGVAVAINLATISNRAVVAGTVVAQALTVDAGMASSGTHTFAATATSGASGGGTSIAVSLGLNIAKVTTLAELSTGADVDGVRRRRFDRCSLGVRFDGDRQTEHHRCSGYVARCRCVSGLEHCRRSGDGAGRCRSGQFRRRR